MGWFSEVGASVYCLDRFLRSSISIKWSPDRPRSITTLQAHTSCVYQALFSPHQPDILATCSTDGTLKILDLRMPAYAPTSNSFTSPLTAAALTVPASGTEILSLDWNKYRPFTLASGGVDKLIKVWDCRMVKLGMEQQGQQVGGMCESQMAGHEWAVRKVQWSPHRPDLLASASYDMTCRVYVPSLVVRTHLRLLIDFSLLIAGRRTCPEMGEAACCTSTTLTRSLWSAARGHCTRKACSQAAAGTAESTSSASERIARL